jgi:hypothetical protein
MTPAHKLHVTTPATSKPASCRPKACLSIVLEQAQRQGSKPCPARTAAALKIAAIMHSSCIEEKTSMDSSCIEQSNHHVLQLHSPWQHSLGLKRTLPLPVVTRFTCTCSTAVHTQHLSQSIVN